MNLSSNLIGNSNDETNFPHKLLLTDTQVSKIHKAFANDSSANIKLSKTLSSKIHPGGFNILDRMNPAEVVYKTANKVKNDVIKIADLSRKCLTGPKKN